jgi:hypothetical protein
MKRKSMPEQPSNFLTAIKYWKMDVGYVIKNIFAWAVQTPSERSPD